MDRGPPKPMNQASGYSFYQHSTGPPHRVGHNPDSAALQNGNPSSQDHMAQVHQQQNPLSHSHGLQHQHQNQHQHLHQGQQQPVDQHGHHHLQYQNGPQLNQHQGQGPREVQTSQQHFLQQQQQYQRGPQKAGLSRQLGQLPPSGGRFTPQLTDYSGNVINSRNASGSDPSGPRFDSMAYPASLAGNPSSGMDQPSGSGSNGEPHSLPSVHPGSLSSNGGMSILPGAPNGSAMGATPVVASAAAVSAANAGAQGGDGPSAILVQEGSSDRSSGVAVPGMMAPQGSAPLSGVNSGGPGYPYHQIMTPGIGRLAANTSPKFNQHPMRQVPAGYQSMPPGPGQIPDGPNLPVPRGMIVGGDRLGSMGPLNGPGYTGGPEHDAVMGHGPSGALELRKTKSQRRSISHQSPGIDMADDSDDSAVSELKKIAIDSLRFPLERAVAHVREDDNGPLAEKSRQVFGMSWLLRSCEAKVDANVPRNRIYARYVAVCSQFTLKPLNSASFGKLVRAIFPEIKTRRLGMRGHSKYHYCGVTLIGDLSDSTGHTPNTSIVTTRSPSPGNTSAGTSLHDGNSDFYNTSMSSVISKHAALTSTPRARSFALVDNDTGSEVSEANSAHSRDHSRHHSHSSTTSHSDDSSRWFEIAKSQDVKGELNLPDVRRFLTGPHDSDLVDILNGLYSSHCRALINCITSLQPKQFIALIGSFPSTLTSPAQRMLRDNVAPWVAVADRATYRRVLSIFASMDLLSVSVEVQEMVGYIAENFEDALSRIRRTVGGSYADTKEQVAGPFLSLLDRFSRATEASHSAQNVLNSDDEIARMKSDWQNFVTLAPVREAPCSANLVMSLIREDIPRILDGYLPSLDDRSASKDLQAPGGNTSMSAAAAAAVAAATALNVGRPGGEDWNGKEDSPGPGDVKRKSSDGLDGTMFAQSSHGGKLALWAEFVGRILAKTSQLAPRLVQVSASAVITAALRDISRRNGESFGSWWELRCWVDESLGWLVDFWQYTTSESEQQPYPYGKADNLSHHDLS